MPAEEWDRVLDVNLLGACHTARAALPQISVRRGQIVFIGSIYSIANGLLGSPYAISKVGVEALGRALRVELAPFGASAMVAYFGWVQTELVRESLDRRGGGRLLEDTVPRILLRRISPAAAAAALVDGVERRAPRVFAPRIWGVISALRGLINPLADRYMERDAKVAAAIREAEAGDSSAPR
jgi:NAD(P)-dependent dehydrogenase (short-subunit alcohol dehydrogenase family)